MVYEGSGLLMYVPCGDSCTSAGGKCGGALAAAIKLNDEKRFRAGRSGVALRVTVADSTDSTGDSYIYLLGAARGDGKDVVGLEEIVGEEKPPLCTALAELAG